MSDWNSPYIQQNVRFELSLQVRELESQLAALREAARRLKDSQHYVDSWRNQGYLDPEVRDAMRDVVAALTESETGDDDDR